MNVNIDINRPQQLPDGDGSTNEAPQEHALDASEEAVTTTTKLDDRVKRCEEGCLLPTPIDDYDDKKDDDINSNHEVQSLRRLSSISDYNKRSLPEDTFSFLIYTNIQSRTFFLAAFVFSLQIAILVILSLDIIDFSNAKNPMSFPPNVDYPVRISEALAIVIAIITQEDVRKAVNLLRDGFDQNLAKAFKGATVAKWTLSIVLRASEGLLGLVVTFLLIMRSSSVLDLLLNFLAIEFVTMLDDVVFALMSEGFIGRMLKKEATKLSNTFYHVSHRSMDSRSAFLVTAAYFFGLFTVFFAGWGVILNKQVSGEFLCDTIYVQFGDEMLPMLGTFSGLFFQHNKTFDRRLSYRYRDGRGGALLAYCHKDKEKRLEKRWTLSLTTDDVFDPCNWIAASSESVDFDVLTTTSSPWIVRASPTSRSLPLTQHFLACHDEYGCQPGHYGLRCEYPEPCQRLEIDPREKGFVKTGGSYFATKFYRLERAETYNHPVYTSLCDNQTLSDETDIILFTGVRWILSYKHLFPGLKDVNDTDGLVEYFSSFHGYFTNYSASYISEPVHIDAPVDATASPLSVRWRYSSLDSRDQRLRPDLQKDFIDASFFCGVCNNSTNPCQFGAVCLSDGSCGYCPNDSSGTMCQIPPISNGKCNPFFNNINFGFDGGDCCESTCRSTPDNICGKAGQGYIDTGYPSCTSSSNQWNVSGDPIHGVSSASRSGLAVALSGKGNILAVSDPGVAIVRLFDKDGSNWILRGQQHVQGPPDSDFGLAISLSDESFNITHNPLSSPTVTLAVGAPKLGLVRVFNCSTIGCIQTGKDINGTGRFGSSLSIAEDGNSIAIGGGDSRRTNGKVKVFTWSKDTNEWQQKGPSLRRLQTDGGMRTEPWELGPVANASFFTLYMQQGYYVSLSGDFLAVGTLRGLKYLEERFKSMNLITQVYKWGEDGWEDRGDGIEKKFYFDESFWAQWPLKPVVLKGNTLAIGSKSSVDVYSWNESSSKWAPREIELGDSKVDELVGWSVDLSEDANILAVGTSVENPQPTDESIRMYKWDGKRYNALFNGVPGGPAASVSLSSDGKAVAVGLPFDAWKGGSTRVYSFHQSSPCNNSSEVPLRISFTTDGSPEETSWELQVDSQVKRSSGSLSGYKYTTFVEEMCVPATSCVKFIVNDTKGDGLHLPGVFALMLNGTEVERGRGSFSFYDVKSFGNCDV